MHFRGGGTSNSPSAFKVTSTGEVVVAAMDVIAPAAAISHATELVLDSSGLLVLILQNQKRTSGSDSSLLSAQHKKS